MCQRCDTYFKQIGAYPARCDDCGRDVPTTASIGPNIDSVAIAAGYQLRAKTYMYHDGMGRAIYCWHYAVPDYRPAAEGA